MNNEEKEKYKLIDKLINQLKIIQMINIIASCRVSVQINNEILNHKFTLIAFHVGILSVGTAKTILLHSIKLILKME